MLLRQTFYLDGSVHSISDVKLNQHRNVNVLDASFKISLILVISRNCNCFDCTMDLILRFCQVKHFASEITSNWDTFS